MSSRLALDHDLQALVRFAVAIASGLEQALEDRAAALASSEVPPAWVDELLLQSVLMVGYPRALVAAAVWRRVSQRPAPDVDPSQGENPSVWARRGEETCRVVYGGNYDRLRTNVRALHPALDAWMVTEGYGRVLSRPGLDLLRRELCTIAQIAWLDSPHQLHSHLRGALHAGAEPAQIEGVLTLVDGDLPSEARASARKVWDQIAGRMGGLKQS